MSDLKLSVLITAIDKFSAPAQKIAGVSEEMAARFNEVEDFTPRMVFIMPAA